MSRAPQLRAWSLTSSHLVSGLGGSSHYKLDADCWHSSRDPAPEGWHPNLSRPLPALPAMTENAISASGSTRVRDAERLACRQPRLLDSRVGPIEDLGPGLLSLIRLRRRPEAAGPAASIAHASGRCPGANATTGGYGLARIGTRLVRDQPVERKIPHGYGGSANRAPGFEPGTSCSQAGALPGCATPRMAFVSLPPPIADAVDPRLKASTKQRVVDPYCQDPVLGSPAAAVQLTAVGFSLQPDGDSIDSKDFAPEGA